MSVEQFGVVDIISIDQQAGHVVLTKSDRLDWADSLGHQTILQTKPNAYLALIESDEILESYPEAAGRSIAFKVVFKFSLDQSAREFLPRAEKVVGSAGFSAISTLCRIVRKLETCGSVTATGWKAR